MSKFFAAIAVFWFIISLIDQWVLKEPNFLSSYIVSLQFLILAKLYEDKA